MGATADAKAHMDSPTPVTAPRVDCWKDVNTVISTPICRVPHTHTHTHTHRHTHTHTDTHTQTHTHTHTQTYFSYQS